MEKSKHLDAAAVLASLAMLASCGRIPIETKRHLTSAEQRDMNVARRKAKKEQEKKEKRYE